VRRWPRFVAGTVSVSGHGPIVLQLARDMQESASFGIPKVHRDALAVSPFRSAQVREPDRRRQRCGDAVRVVRPYKDTVRAS
jgi:hypothetical protein